MSSVAQGALYLSEFSRRSRLRRATRLYGRLFLSYVQVSLILDPLTILHTLRYLASVCLDCVAVRVERRARLDVVDFFDLEQQLNLRKS